MATAQTSTSNRRIRVGIDTGGTFTDVVAFDEDSGELVTTKTPSTPANPADGFISGIEKILEPDFTVSLRVAPPGVVVTNEDEIPEWFWIPQEPKLDRKRILDCLKAGTAVMGASLSNTRVCLSIRTK